MNEIGDACRPISLLISIRNRARTAMGSMYDRQFLSCFRDIADSLSFRLGRDKCRFLFRLSRIFFFFFSRCTQISKKRRGARFSLEMDSGLLENCLAKRSSIITPRCVESRTTDNETMVNARGIASYRNLESRGNVGCRLHANWSTPTPYLRALAVLT